MKYNPHKRRLRQFVNRFCLFFLLLYSQLEARAAVDEAGPLILLFHGIGANAQVFKNLELGLREALPSVAVRALTCVEGMPSLELPIAQQAEACFQEVMETVANASKRPMLLVGHSQGGLRAYAFLQRYGKTLPIKGLVSLAAPWEGAPGARVDQKMLCDHLTDAVAADLQKLADCLGYSKDVLHDQLRAEASKNQWMCQFPGAQDVIAGSSFLSDVAQQLARESTPILAVAAGQANFGALLSPTQKKQKFSFKALNRFYTFLTVGDRWREDAVHDMWIPRYSQHAKTIAPKKKIFQRVLVKDAFHSEQIWGMLAVPDRTSIVSHPHTLRAIVQFAKKQLPL